MGGHMEETGTATPELAAEEREGAPSHYQLLTPKDWFRIPLRDAEQRARSVQALIDLTMPSRDERAVQRRELRDMLTTVTGTAAARDGIEMYLSTDAVLGVPVPATLLVSAEPGDPDPPVRLPVAWMADGVRDKHGPEAEVSVVRLPSGEAVRCRRQGTSEDTRELGQAADRPNTLLDFYLPIPESGGWLILTFSTPIPELAQPLTELFDAIAGSLRWTQDVAVARG
ncbi:hypothetical protein [Streptomyces litchfieldiae]|uniref:Uncharacterized protein n=1 Tax=Streptomyces litchfieldiae TaxID=3075543 RepID=A0ABU2MWB8_9ACTN|nr:hypothetical protein [Streptomyces sp. DSM 44938]MDT0345948.1 hypothetical protein [Streptomyces sp. DSM 44938]